jgi:abortive infection bacteriophage resistance protein
MTVNSPNALYLSAEAYLEKSAIEIDINNAVSWLQSIGNYRFNGYLKAFEDSNCILFSDVINLYKLDKKLRISAFDAIEIVEIRLRAAICRTMSYWDSYAHYSKKYINPKHDVAKWEKFQAKIIPNTHLEKSLEDWDFGTLSYYYEFLKKDYQIHIAKSLGLESKDSFYLILWMREINSLRNSCAHHKRIWNRRIQAKLPAPTKLNDFSFHKASEENHRNICFILKIIACLMPLDLGKTWFLEVESILIKIGDIPHIDPKVMGVF